MGDVTNMPRRRSPIRAEWLRYPMLVVDDDAEVLDMLRELFELHGLNVRTADSGDAGLAALERHPANLIISDQRMNGMTGTSFLKEVKRRHPQQEVVTMILSAFSDINVILDAMNEAGAYQYMTKPWEPAELLQKVAQALEVVHLHAERKHMAEAKKWMLCRMAQMDNFSMFGAFGDYLHKRFGTMSKILPDVVPILLEDGQRKGGSALRNAMRLQEDAQLFSAVLEQIALVGRNFATLDPREAFTKQSPVPILRDQFEKAKGATLREKSGMKWAFSLEIEEDIPELWINEHSFACAIHNLLENAIVYSLGPVVEGQPRVVTLRAGFFSPEKLYKTGTRSREMHPPPVMEEDTFWVEVEDNGKGMTPFDADRRFQFFETEADQDFAATGRPEQLSPFKDGYNLSPYLHIGMGLPVAMWCISSHDGNLRLLNPGKKGACMRIDIPLEQQELRHRLRLA